MKSNPSLNKWHERSIYYGENIKGVLFKSVPDQINEHIHSWHAHVIKDFLANKGIETLLDVGCGYGRLSSEIIRDFSQVKPYGLDISPYYTELYRKRTGYPALSCAIEDIPEDMGTFDAILIVTVLMYIPKEKLETCLARLWSHLKSGGVCIIIEAHSSGNFFRNPFNIVTSITKIIHSKSVHTGGHAFSDKEIETILSPFGGKIIRKAGLPFTTFFFIPISFLAMILPYQLMQLILKFIRLLDKTFKCVSFPTIHKAYCLVKTK